ncbi:MAG: 5-formyltetrahydrofolate cyclo-ligase [Peptococcia bacterium]
MDKQLLRQQARKKRDSLSWLEVQGKSHEISQRLIMMPEYQQADVVMLYLSFENEVDTKGLIITSWKQKKKVVIPVCQPADKTILVSELHSFDELTPGTWNISEPKKEFLRPIPASRIDLAIIPGLAFDVRGNRLGYGAGYYDRFLPNLSPNCAKIALSYEMTMQEFLPTEAHDVPMDYIITEAKIYKVKR